MYLKFMLTYLLLMSVAVDAQEPLAAKMTCHTAKFLSADEAAAMQAVELEGVVTCIPAGWKGFFIGDSTGGVYCEAMDSEAEASFWPVQLGEKLVIQGVSAKGHFNSFVRVKRILHREAGTLPSPVTLKLASNLREVHDADLVSVDGMMVRITNIAGEMEYRLVANGHECEVVHAGFRVDPKLPIHTEVEISGVVIPIEGSGSFKIIVPSKEYFRVIRSQEQLYAETPVESLESVVAKRAAGQLVRFSAEVFRVSDNKAWLSQTGFGVEWNGRLDTIQSKGSIWQFAGITKLQGDRVSIDYGNVLGNASDKGIATSPVAVNEMESGNFSNRIIKTRGTLVDRNTIDGVTYLTLENQHARWFATSLEPSVSDSPLVFGATYAVTGLVTSSKADSQQQILMGDEHGIQFVSAPPLSASHKLALSALLTSLLAVGLCISLISYGHLTQVKKRLEMAQSDLKEANESLESRIEKRTRELQSLNQALILAEREAKQANDAKSAFLANMSHEIRTPMTAILGFTEILRDDSALGASDRQEFLDTISRNGDHLLSLIDEILDLAKIESGKLSLNFESVNPVSLVQDVISLLRVRANVKKLALEFTVTQSTPNVILTDPTRLKQVLLNLIGNAIKFTEAGQVHVHLANDSITPNRIRIEVTDSGIGIRGEHLPKLFSVFEQLDNSLTRVHGGTGLGLSISKSLVNMLGGDITVRSDLGVGSCFQVVLPIEPAHLIDASRASRGAFATVGSSPWYDDEKGL